MAERDGMEVLSRVRSVELSDGRRFIVSPLSVGDYISCREQSLDYYKRQELRTYTKNVDLIKEAGGDVNTILGEAFEKAKEISYEDLPSKEVTSSEGTQKIEYSMWWMGETPEGMMFAVWLSLRKDESQRDMTLDEVYEIFTEESQRGDLEDIAQAVGEVTQPSLAGNGEASLDAGQKRRERRRRRRRERK